MSNVIAPILYAQLVMAVLAMLSGIVLTYVLAKIAGIVLKMGRG